MQVASLELCRTLYELSGWDNDFPELLHYLDGEIWYKVLYQSDSEDETTYCPAYPLGYLLRKLPKVNLENDGFGWIATYGSKYGRADTPEDCAAKLAIQLFKRGILTRE